jgi:hypothetical protein
VGSGGPRPPRRPQRGEAAPLPEGWRPALAVAGIPRWRGLGLMRSSPTLPTWTSLKPRGRGRWRGTASWSVDRPRSSCRRLGSWGLGILVRRGFDLGGPVDRSLRRRGQHLVVAGALLRALIGAALGLIVEDGQTSTAVAAPGRARGAVLALSPPSSHPPASRAVGSGKGSCWTNEGGRASRLGRILELVDLHTVQLHRDGILA